MRATRCWSSATRIRVYRRRAIIWVITYDEVREVVRKKMKVKASEVSDMQLKGLFCKLDSDDGKDEL